MDELKLRSLGEQISGEIWDRIHLDRFMKYHEGIMSALLVRQDQPLLLRKERALDGIVVLRDEHFDIALSLTDNDEGGDT